MRSPFHQRRMSCYSSTVTSKKGVNGIGVPKHLHDESRGLFFAESAAFLSVAPVYGGSDGGVQAPPVLAGGARYANLSELPPSIGVGGGGFSKLHHLEAVMAQSLSAHASAPTTFSQASRRAAPTSSITGTIDPIQLHADAHNALNMAVFYLRQPQANTDAARRKAVQALAALRGLSLALEG